MNNLTEEISRKVNDDYCKNAEKFLKSDVSPYGKKPKTKTQIKKRAKSKSARKSRQRGRK